MTFDSSTLSSIKLTLQLASLTTVLLLLIATPIAWWLSKTTSWLRKPVGAIVALPLVLPPTVLGFYLLVTLGPNGPIGIFTNTIGWGYLSFSFTGLVIGSIIYSLPFAVQPLQHAFENMSARPMEVAATLRASPIDAFLHVAIPLAKPGFYTAAILSFAHTIGEFGVVLMIGGNIPEQTRVVSTQIYGYVEAMQYTQAHALSAALLIFSFVILLGMSLFKQRTLRVMP